MRIVSIESLLMEAKKEPHERIKWPALSPVAEYLVSIGVEEIPARQAAFVAGLALERYQSAVEVARESRAKSLARSRNSKAVRSPAKIYAEKIARAANALVKAIESADDGDWSRLEFAHAHPIVDSKLPREAPFYIPAGGADALWHDRIGPRMSFAADARIVRDAATDALQMLKGRGRPAGAKAALVDELSVIYWRATGKAPTAAGEACWEQPISQFGQFVRCTVAVKERDFCTGFAELLTAAVKRFRAKVSEQRKK
jgi:hypothetical protein